MLIVKILTKVMSIRHYKVDIMTSWRAYDIISIIHFPKKSQHFSLPTRLGYKHSIVPQCICI